MKERVQKAIGYLILAGIGYGMFSSCARGDVICVRGSSCYPQPLFWIMVLVIFVVWGVVWGIIRGLRRL